MYVCINFNLILIYSNSYLIFFLTATTNKRSCLLLILNTSKPFKLANYI